MWRWVGVVSVIVAALLLSSRSEAQTLIHQVYLPQVAKVAEPMMIGEPVPVPPSGPPNWATPTPVPTAVPGTVAIEPSTLDVTEANGRLVFLGEVQNNTTQPVGSVKIVASLFNTASQLVGTDSAYIRGEFILPADRVCFLLSLPKPADYWRYELQVTHSRNTLQPALLTLFGDVVRPKAGGTQYEMLGQIRNDGSTTARGASWLATFYRAGKVHLCGTGYAEIATLTPGQVTPFRNDVPIQSMTGLTYRVKPQGYLPR